MLDSNTASVMNEVAQSIMPQQDSKPPGYDSYDEESIWKWDDVKDKMTTLESDWSQINAEIAKNRDDRDIDIDIKRLRSTGEALPDDSLIPRRVVDNNISREKAPYIEYITKPRRQVVLPCVSDPKVNPEVMEKEYTRIARYPGWTVDYYQTLDAAQLNAWASIQVMFDPDMPGHFSRKYLASDRLMFPVRSTIKGFQDSEYIVVVVDIMISKFKAWEQEFGFDGKQIEMVVTKERIGGKDKEDTIQIKQLFYKCKDGTVFMAWYHGSCADWLRAPKPFWNGQVEMQQASMPSEFGDMHMEMQGAMQQMQPQMVPVYEKDYPIEIQIYRLTEQEIITRHRGRAFLDKFIQIAQTIIWSSTINKLNRSSNVYCSPKGTGNETNPGAPKIEKGVTLVNGAMYDKPAEFWGFPEPSMMPIALSQALSQENSNDTKNTAFQVINRKDSRKTKKELSMAENESKSSESVDLTLYSEFVTRVEKRCFKIVQSRAKAGKLPSFLAVSPQTMRDGTQQEAMANREYLLKQAYDVKASGDTDYIERKEKINMMSQVYELVAQTGIGPEFLGEMLVLMFPDDGTKWRNRLQETAQQPAVIQALVKTLQGVLQEYGKTMRPEEISGIDQVLQAALKSLGINTQPQPPQMEQKV